MRHGRTGLLAASMLAVAATGLGGCLVRTAAEVATLPVRAGSKVIDWTTTSQAEADRNRGRRERRAEERAARDAGAQAKRCRARPQEAECAGDPASPPR